MKNLKDFSRTLGPGLMFAAASVGVSHLVQSTRSGAEFGVELAPLLILVCVLKYPTFQFAGNYAQATGKSLLHGYNQIGRWALVLWGCIAFFTMSIVTAAVVLVTGGALNVMLGTQFTIDSLALMILAVTAVALMTGGYVYLEKFVKLLVLTFTVLTLFATAIALPNFDFGQVSFFGSSAYSVANVFFLAAIIGWMPNGMESSVLQSTWTAEKVKLDAGFKKHAMLLDLRVGYVGTVLLALCFMLLGASLMHSQQIKFENSSIGFIGQLIDLYAQSVGSWSIPIIKLTIFAILYTTVIAVMDGYSRVMSDCVLINQDEDHKSIRFYYGFLILNCAVAYLIVRNWVTSFSQIIDFVTTLSFVISPVIAILNMRALYTSSVAKEDRPTRRMKMYGIVGILFMSVFALGFLYLRFFWSK